MTPTSRLARLIPAAVSISLLLTACTATTPVGAESASEPGAATSDAAPASNAAPDASGEPDAAPQASDGLCSRVGFDRLNQIMTAGGEALTSEEPVGDDCRYTGETGTYLVSEKAESYDAVLAGRAAEDQTMGAKAGWLEGDRLFLLQHGSGTIAVTVEGSGPVDVSQVMSVAYSVDALLP